MSRWQVLCFSVSMTRCQVLCVSVHVTRKVLWVSINGKKCTCFGQYDILCVSVNMTHFMCFGQYDTFYVFRSIWQDHNPCAPRTVWWIITFVRNGTFSITAWWPIFVSVSMILWLLYSPLFDSFGEKAPHRIPHSAEQTSRAVLTYGAVRGLSAKHIMQFTASSVQHV